jgi:hypothetical protein
MKRKTFLNLVSLGAVSMAGRLVFGQKTSQPAQTPKLPKVPQPQTRIIPRIQQLAEGGS